MEIKKEYNYTFGVLTALAIVFVVAGHLNLDILTINGMYPYYSFHMALFMFISGYFYRSAHTGSFRKFLIKKIKRLIFPYFIWNFFYGIVVAILHKYGFAIGGRINIYTLVVQPFIDGHQFYFNLASWFLIALFFVEIAYLLTRRAIGRLILKKKTQFLILAIFFSVLGSASIRLSLQGYNRDYWLILIRTLFFMPFYYMGDLYNEILEKHDNLNDYLYFLIIVGMQMTIIMHYGWIPTFSAVFGQFFYNPYVQYLVAVLGILFWLRIAKLITPIVKKDGYIIYIGKNSFSIMMHHIGILYLLMLFLALINKVTGLFNDINVDVIMTSAGIWYCPKGNNAFLLFYLVLAIVLLVMLCKIKDKIILYIHQRFGKDDRDER